MSDSVEAHVEAFLEENGFVKCEFNDECSCGRTLPNWTQLNPETAFERHVFHRDQFAHYLRWTHLLKIIDIGKKAMD